MTSFRSQAVQLENDTVQRQHGTIHFAATVKFRTACESSCVLSLSSRIIESHREPS